MTTYTITVLLDQAFRAIGIPDHLDLVFE